MDRQECTWQYLASEIGSLIPKNQGKVVFGLHTLSLIDFCKIYQFKGLEPKNKGHTNFYECCDSDLTKKYIQAIYLYIPWSFPTKCMKIWRQRYADLYQIGGALREYQNLRKRKCNIYFFKFFQSVKRSKTHIFFLFLRFFMSQLDQYLNGRHSLLINQRLYYWTKFD